MACDGVRSTVGGRTAQAFNNALPHANARRAGQRYRTTRRYPQPGAVLIGPEQCDRQILEWPTGSRGTSSNRHAWRRGPQPHSPSGDTPVHSHCLAWQCRCVCCAHSAPHAPLYRAHPMLSIDLVDGSAG